MSEDEDEAGSEHATPDPLEEQTQPLERGPEGAVSRRLPDAAARAGSPQDPEATILSLPQAPPPLIEETPTLVLPEDDSPPEPEPELPESPCADQPPLEEDVVAPPAESDEPAWSEAEAPEWIERSHEIDPEDAATALSVSAAAATVVGDAPSRSTLAPSSSLHPMLLERVEPSLGRGERMRLDASHWRVRLGRAESNDIRLYTASASREHAEIAGNEAGEWILTPVEGKTVLIDGDSISEPIVLEVGMNLVMGGDQLRCVTEGLERAQMSAQTSAEGLADQKQGVGSRIAAIGFSWWLIAAVALVGVGLITFAWLGG